MSARAGGFLSPTRSSCPASTSTRASRSTIPTRLKWHDFVFRARGRDLRGAIFDLASLPKVDFEGAQLQGASLDARSFRARRLRAHSLRTHRSLQDARAQLQGASLVMTRSFRARRSTARSFRARRSMARSFRARRSTARSFRARRSMARSFRARRSTRAASGRVDARPSRASFRARRSTARSFRARRSTTRSFRARRSSYAQLQGASLEERFWAPPTSRAHVSGAPIADPPSTGRRPLRMSG